MIHATFVTHIQATPADTVTLTFDDRHRRRMGMTGDNGTQFVLDLDQATELCHGDDLLLTDGRHVRVIAAAEDLMCATCADPLHLTRTAWHVGNRHLPCQIMADRIVLRWDHVIADMLSHLGCCVTRFDGPFTPEGGAYGHGRTHSHAH